MSESWLDRKVLVTVGTGGVGKTTIAAALGLAAAQRGKRALVLTIDPARRLADALGVGDLGHDPVEVPRELLRAAGVPPDGSLAAMMLDELLERYAPDEEALAQVLENPIYRNLTDALAGSREYSAMEKLYQLHNDGRYDLVVVDTPPAAHALDFLDAPRRLTGFLDSPILRLMFMPALAMGRTGFRLFRFGSNLFLPAIERITGIEFLRMVSEFLLAFEGLWAGVGSRAREIEKLLRAPESGFLLVVGPDPVQRRRAREFWARLDRESVHLAGLVLNRVRVWPGAGTIPALEPAQRRRARRALAEQLAAHGLEDAGATADELVASVARYADLARRDLQLRAEFERSIPLDPGATRVVPLFTEDVNELAGLARMADHLFAEAPGV